MLGTHAYFTISPVTAAGLFVEYLLLYVAKGIRIWLIVNDCPCFKELSVKETSHGKSGWERKDEVTRISCCFGIDVYKFHCWSVAEYHNSPVPSH